MKSMIKKRVFGFERNSVTSAQGSVACSCEHDSVLLGFINSSNVFQIIDINNSVQWNLLISYYRYATYIFS
jgi:hypothetical protein